MTDSKKICPKRKAIFLDRDGTIIKDRGHLGSPSQVEFFNETFSSLRQAVNDYMLFIITNQQGISEGIIRREQVDQVIPFDHTRCHFGGFRLWFLCPRCRRRVAILYGAGKYFFAATVTASRTPASKKARFPA